MKEVKVDEEKGEINIFVAFWHRWAICPVSGENSKVYDLREMRRWRHLNLMQYKTYINSRVPRVFNEEWKVSSIEVPWSDYSGLYYLPVRSGGDQSTPDDQEPNENGVLF